MAPEQLAKIAFKVTLPLAWQVEETAEAAAKAEVDARDVAGQ